VLAGEQARVFECPQSNNGELGTPKDSIGFEVAHFARRLGGRKMSKLYVVKTKEMVIEMPTFDMT
jgi:hypothetical protein